MKAMYTNMAENRRQALEELRQDPEDRMYDGQGRSDYASQAQALSGKSENGYWTRPTEMFARAFESWVFDKVTAMGARVRTTWCMGSRDEFAGGGYRGNPYPTGEERARTSMLRRQVGKHRKNQGDGQGRSALHTSTAPTRPGSAQDKAVMQAIADGKNTRDVLRLVANGSKARSCARWRNTAEGRYHARHRVWPYRQGQEGQPDPRPVPGQERHDCRCCSQCRYAAERIFMHEAMHAATMRALKKGGLARVQLQKLMAHVQKQKGAAGFYGMQNVDEFVAEVFTNPDFRLHCAR